MRQAKGDSKDIELRGIGPSYTYVSGRLLRSGLHCLGCNIVLHLTTALAYDDGTNNVIANDAGCQAVGAVLVLRLRVRFGMLGAHGADGAPMLLGGTCFSVRVPTGSEFAPRKL